jgi:NAD(P)-dependent dehydrogenase (short-subunit alcohol dehydrogenase family)
MLKSQKVRFRAWNSWTGLLRPTRHGQVAAVVGGTRGLGLDLVRELKRRGYEVALCARDAAEVERVRGEFAQRGLAVLARVHDATDAAAMEQFVTEIVRQYGRLDVLITCAATIQVGPFEAMTRVDFEDSLQQIFWTTYHASMAALPIMRKQKRGHMAHVTSFGGKISVPHLLPYCTAKFAATGFSQGLRAAVAKDGIRVTTITPGVLRTGAEVNAPFKGNLEAEYTWFAAAATLPWVSLGSERAARRILDAVEHGKAECTLSMSTRLLVAMNALFPGLLSRMLAVQNTLLPDGNEVTGSERGADVAERSQRPWIRTITSLGRKNAERHHAYPGPVTLPLVKRGIRPPPAQA